MQGIQEKLRLIQDLPGEADANMEADRRLAREALAGSNPAALRIYGWTGRAITLGRRQDPGSVPREWKRENLPTVRRPTGGGAVLHRPEEVTYALVVPRGQLRGRPGEIPVRLHARLKELLVEAGLLRPEELSLWEGGRRERVQVCFAAPVQGDLMFRGQKTAGAALRAWREGALLQGTVQGMPVDRPVLAGLLVQAVVWELNAAG